MGGEIQCDDILEETDDCTMMKIMYEIVNGQNHQIQKMREILESKGWPPVDDCKVAVSGITKEIIMEEHYSDVKSEVGESAASSHIISIVFEFSSIYVRMRFILMENTHCDFHDILLASNTYLPLGNLCCLGIFMF